MRKNLNDYVHHYLVTPFLKFNQKVKTNKKIHTPKFIRVKKKKNDNDRGDSVCFTAVKVKWNGNIHASEIQKSWDQMSKKTMMVMMKNIITIMMSKDQRPPSISLIALLLYLQTLLTGINLT